MYSQVSNAASAERDALAEVDAARQLADHEDVDALELLGLQRRGRGELGRRRDGPQVREQAERLADREQALLGAVLHGNVGPLRPADGAEQDARRRLAGCDRRVGQRRAGGVVRRAADQCVLELELQRVLRRDALEHAHGRGRDLGADAVAGQDDDARAHACACS